MGPMTPSELSGVRHSGRCLYGAGEPSWHDADVILARGSQYSTQPASASHTFFTKLQLGKKEKKMEIDLR